MAMVSVILLVRYIVSLRGIRRAGEGLGECLAAASLRGPLSRHRLAAYHIKV